MKIRQVVFDLYGTLVQFGVRRRPFLKGIRWAAKNGRGPRPDDARKIMTTDGEVRAIFQKLDIALPESLIADIEQDIQIELGSLSLYDDVETTISTLSQQGVNIAVCSNLAKPYGKAIHLLPSIASYSLSLSYLVGAIKPDVEIYHHVRGHANVEPEECLFIGDTFTADYDGPRRVRFNALHLTREKKADVLPHEISRLVDIFDHI